MRIFKLLLVTFTFILMVACSLQQQAPTKDEESQISDETISKLQKKVEEQKQLNRDLENENKELLAQLSNADNIIKSLNEEIEQLKTNQQTNASNSQTTNSKETPIEIKIVKEYVSLGHLIIDYEAKNILDVPVSNIMARIEYLDSEGNIIDQKKDSIMDLVPNSSSQETIMTKFDERIHEVNIVVYDYKINSY